MPGANPGPSFKSLRTLKKHYRPEQAPVGLEFDQLLNFVTTLHFQDAYNFVLDRVQHCVIHYAAPNGRFYPFCTWNSGPCHRYAVERQYSQPLKDKASTEV